MKNQSFLVKNGSIRVKTRPVAPTSQGCVSMEQTSTTICQVGCRTFHGHGQKLLQHSYMVAHALIG